MRRRSFFSSLLVALTLSGSAAAAPVVWTVSEAPTRANLTGGPWVLAEGTATDPTAGYPSPNPGTSAFQPFYQAFTSGTDRAIQGYFDYRPKDLGEAIVAARSTDGGKTWTFQSLVAKFDSPSIANDAAAASDHGEGHPFVATFGVHTYLYTLDRTTGFVDSAGMIAHELTPSASDPLSGAPAAAQLGSSAATRTSGLVDPDGIVAVVPGTSNPWTIIYLQKTLGTLPAPDVTVLHLADTTDGLTFANDRIVSGITDASTTFVGPRGSLLKYEDGRFGLFFSAGLAGEDADAFHYIGYAESSDALHWTVVNGVDKPLLSTDASKDPTGGQPWYAGRVYAPSVTLSADGCTATLVMSGYKSVKPKQSPNDYRQIGRATLTRPCGAADGGTTGDAGGSLDAGAVSDDAGAGGSRADAGGGAGSSGGSTGCALTPYEQEPSGPLAFLAAAGAALMAYRRRRAR